jgi:hypothetical protein
MSKLTMFRITVFWVFQIMLIGGTVAWAVQRQSTLYTHTGLPSSLYVKSLPAAVTPVGDEQIEPLPTDSTRTDPLRVEPLYDRPAVVSNEQLLGVLHKLRRRCPFFGGISAA